MSTSPQNDDSPPSLELEEIKNGLVSLVSRLQGLEEKLDKTAARNEDLSRVFNRALDDFRNSLKSFRDDLDRTIQSSRETTANLEARFVILDKHLNLIQNDIDGIRKNELVRISADLQKCPTLQSFMEELSKPTSNLATKSDLMALKNQLSELSGTLNGFSRNSFISTIAVIASIIAAFVTLSSRATPPTPTPTLSPTPTSTSTP